MCRSQLAMVVQLVKQRESSKSVALATKYWMTRSEAVQQARERKSTFHAHVSKSENEYFMTTKSKITWVLFLLQL